MPVRTLDDPPIDGRVAVLVGVGTSPGGAGAPGHAGLAESWEVPEEPEPVDLMVAAARAAVADAAAPELAARLDLVAVPEGNWTYPDPARLVAQRLGSAGARTVRVDIGVPQCTPIRVAVERIRRGEIDVALVVGGETKATQQRIQRAGGTPPHTDQGDVEPDERWVPRGELMADPEIIAGLWDPVAQYACIENALGHAEGRTLDQLLDEISELWGRFNRVAADNPLAAFPEPRSAEQLRVAGPGNRPLSFPYAKWHSTQWGVDQAAALLLCSTDIADELHVPVERRVHPRALVESSLSVSLTKRAEIHRWPAMKVLGDAVEAHLGRALSEVEHTEVYSCFPAAVRVQQRELGLPLDGTPTVTGGMAFAGGPFNNFTYQATAAVVDRVRRDPGSLGLVTTVSGLLTKPGLAVWSTDPGDGEPLLADLVDDATEATATREVTGEHDGPATVATCTVSYSGDVAHRAFVVADLPDGRRWIGTTDDPGLLAEALAGRLIGSAVVVDGGTCRSTDG